MARLEGGDVNPRLSTLERYADAVGRRVDEAPDYGLIDAVTGARSVDGE
ncbi:helix-turn-helix domain-containing protein [Rhodococcus tibetensis]|uniref:Transcriptional regulator n=1 Tax=Rhodococcus tibetensis TaxID=2965064 RepID=A0ABT1Q663_9NOCA|nr:hypothetical protein [Rhodococcus sp. FXJ9.536]MCQ4117727.1 hypothetical protein [Rhodococcus sp. FXJ9.536]